MNVSSSIQQKHTAVVAEQLSKNAQNKQINIICKSNDSCGLALMPQHVLGRTYVAAVGKPAEKPPIGVEKV